MKKINLLVIFSIFSFSIFAHQIQNTKRAEAQNQSLINYKFPCQLTNRPPIILYFLSNKQEQKVKQTIDSLKERSLISSGPRVVLAWDLLSDEVVQMSPKAKERAFHGIDNALASFIQIQLTLGALQRLKTVDKESENSVLNYSHLGKMMVTLAKIDIEKLIVASFLGMIAKTPGMEKIWKSMSYSWDNDQAKLIAEEVDRLFSGEKKVEKDSLGLAKILKQNPEGAAEVYAKVLLAVAKELDAQLKIDSKEKDSLYSAMEQVLTLKADKNILFEVLKKFRKKWYVENIAKIYCSTAMKYNRPLHIIFSLDHTKMSEAEIFPELEKLVKHGADGSIELKVSKE